MLQAVADDANDTLRPNNTMSVPGTWVNMLLIYIRYLYLQKSNIIIIIIIITKIRAARVPQYEKWIGDHLQHWQAHLHQHTTGHVHRALIWNSPLCHSTGNALQMLIGSGHVAAAHSHECYERQSCKHI